MSDKVTIDGNDYELNDNPSLRTVREVQSMQMDVIRNYLSEEQLKEMDSLDDEGEIVRAIIDKEGMDGFQNVMWDRSMMEPVQTISLACDEKFNSSDFDEYGASDFIELRESAEKVLNGTAGDFFNRLGIGMSLSEEEMQRQASVAQDGI